jgi:cytidyltransferase-like protein
MNEGHSLGIVLGRFQPIHLGHIEYLRAARKECSRLVIGITNPDLQDLVDTPEDRARSAAGNNPYTYFQRATMVEAACLDDGWNRSDLMVVPAPINTLSSLPQYLPRPEEATVFMTIYDEWGEAKKRKLEGLGYDVVTLWRRSMSERLTSGTRIRAQLRTGTDEWKRFVAPSVAVLLQSHAETSSQGER